MDSVDTMDPTTSASMPSEKTGPKATQGDEFYVIVNVIGVSLRCVVNPEWPCEALLGAAAEAYHARFMHSEVPDCNVVFHRKKQEFLVAGTRIIECCVCGDELELSMTGPTPENEEKATSSVSRSLGDGETSEFCVLFHKLPLGFTMKRGTDRSTEVGTIYPKSAATHFHRLAPGVTIVSIAGTPLLDLGLRQVHDLIKQAELPLEIRFRARELVVSPSLSPESVPHHKVSCSPVAVSRAKPPTNQRGGRRQESSVRSNGSNGSRNGGRGKRKEDRVGQRHGIANQQEGGTSLQVDTQEFNVHLGSLALESDQTAEAELVETIEQLKVALLRKHEEAKQIARQLELCSEKLLALRGESTSTTSRQAQTTTTTTKNPGKSKVRLTPEVLEAMDEKVGLPRRGLGAYTSSNVSSISGYSAHSMPVARSANMRARSARATALANADNVSVSSCASNSSTTSARRGNGHSPRGTALRNLNKRYNYMPQRYEATTTSASETGATSLSSRGAVMSRARISRDSFITKSESPGVGYYDVKVKDRVKGGEIGDSDRILPWS